jgi:endonuclease/exonuclease/phosphatase family metal-dependent hydrolase
LQCEKILEIASRDDLPTIILGDFNLFPNTKSIAMLEKKFKNLIKEFAIKSTRPDFKDDLDK